MRLLVILIPLILVIGACKSEESKSRLKYELKEPASTADKKPVNNYSETSSIDLTSYDTASAIAMDSDNSVYVGLKNKIVKFSNEHKVTASIDIPEAEEGITALIEKDGILYIAQKTVIRTVTSDLKTLSTKTLKLDEKSWITSIALAGSDIFLADAGNRIVLRYSKEYKLINKIAGKDEAKGVSGLIIPSPYLDVVEGNDNDIWVVNPGRHALENYSYEGRLISSWERASFSIDGFCGCCNPSHIALMKDGSFVTSEKGLPRIKIHAPTGDLKTVVAGTDQFFEETKNMDLALSTEEDIYVLDPLKKKIRIFKKQSSGAEK